MSEHAGPQSYSPGLHAAGAAERAEHYLAQAHATAIAAAGESLPERRAILLESARRLNALAKAELRIAEHRR